MTTFGAPAVFNVRRISRLIAGASTMEMGSMNSSTATVVVAPGASGVEAGLLRAEGLTKSFGVVKALQGVDIAVAAGSVHAVVGHNGAGKSTLMKLLSGVFPQDAGQIRLEGKTIGFSSPRDALNSGISMVHQELSVIPDLDVAENIFLGREPLSRLGLVRRRELYDETRRVLSELDLDVSPHTICSRLSVGVRQMIEIAQAISRRSKILILDEPTSALSETEQERLFDFVRRLQTRGLGILYVSHKLDEVEMLSDTVTVLRDGKLVAVHPTLDLDPGRMVELMVGHVVTKGAPPAAPRAEMGLEVVSLASEETGIMDVSFSVRRGEIVGLAGMLGSGRTELFELLFGIRRADSGEIRVLGQATKPRSPIDAMAAQIALVPEDRRSQGIFAELPVWKNIGLASFYDLFRGPFASVHEAQERKAAREQVDLFRIATPSINQEVQFLSGGNQQKVILARWLLRRPEVLLLDDPTAGIDVGAKGEIHTLIRKLAGDGLTVVISSSEFPELLDVCHRILVIRDGRIVAEMEAQTATEAELVRLATAADDAAERSPDSVTPENVVPENVDRIHV